MACIEQCQDVVRYLLIRERLSMLIRICQKRREDVVLSSDQASSHISPSLVDPYLQLLSYRIRSCVCFTICCSWDVDWQLNEAFHHSVEETMEQYLDLLCPLDR